MNKLNKKSSAANAVDDTCSTPEKGTANDFMSNGHLFGESKMSGSSLALKLEPHGIYTEEKVTEENHGKVSPIGIQRIQLSVKSVPHDSERSKSKHHKDIINIVSNIWNIGINHAQEE